ncbi:MAG: hypothetical protein JO040_14270 [Gemmatimonadetes bacterium]|nr:hypothetical protein [Gemmatimonadota bacterium]
MAFTLRITFSGLCLFVPEPAADGNTGRMHVLMPSMFGHCSGADRHVAAVAYDTGHLAPGGTPTGITALAPISGRQVTPVAGEEASLALCGHIPDLREITQRPVDPDHLGSDLGKKLAARVTLGAGRITRVSPGVCWEWRPGEFRPIAHRVEWEIPDVEGEQLTLVSELIGGGGEQKALGTLFPMGGRVNLVVYHETTQDLPPEPLSVDSQPVPARGFTPHHFTAYYTLFGGPVSTVLPRFAGKLADCPPPANPCEPIPPDMGGMPYTCLVAGVGSGGGTGG